jgi:hypothetical protein
LNKHGYKFKNFFYNSNNLYIEIENINTGNMIFISLEDRYTFNIKNRENTFTIKKMDINDTEIDNYFIKEIQENDYDKIYINEQISDTASNIDKLLESDYNHTMNIKDFHKKDLLKLKEIKKQLKRLKLCVSTIDYKLNIMYKKYLIIINRNNDICIYNIMNFEYRNDLLIFNISIDIENFYSNVNSVNDNIYNIRENIYNILNKNQKKHLININNLQTHFVKIIDIIHISNSLKNIYLDVINRLNNYLNIIIKKEIEITKEFKYTNSELDIKNSLNNDIERTQIKIKTNQELLKLKKIKEEIIKEIAINRQKLDTIYLTIDETCFENIITINNLTKNIKNLEVLINDK